VSVLRSETIKYTLNCILSTTPVILTDAKTNTVTSILLQDIIWSGSQIRPDCRNKTRRRWHTYL